MIEAAVLTPAPTPIMPLTSRDVRSDLFDGRSNRDELD